MVSHCRGPWIFFIRLQFLLMLMTSVFLSPARGTSSVCRTPCPCTQRPHLHRLSGQKVKPCCLDSDWPRQCPVWVLNMQFLAGLKASRCADVFGSDVSLKVSWWSTEKQTADLQWRVVHRAIATNRHTVIWTWQRSASSVGRPKLWHT